MHPRPIVLGIALVAGAPLAGCLLPVSAVVPRAALDELGRTTFVEHLDERRLEREIAALLGPDLARAALDEGAYYRLGSPRLGPVEPGDFDVPGSALTHGLASGDLLLAKNAKPQSLGSTIAVESFTWYDHVGLLELDDAGVWVYESWPSVELLGKFPDFASRFTGGPARVPLSTFLRRYEVVAAVRYPDAERNARVVAGALESLSEGIRFDPYHDPERPELSCSEYASYLLEEKAGYELDLPISRISTWPSIVRTRSALGFDTPAYLVPDAFARHPGARTVGWISCHASLTEVLALREAARALHARFGPESSVGDYLGPHRFRLFRWRENARAYLEWMKGYARARPDAVREELRVAADVLYPLFFVPR